MDFESIPLTTQAPQLWEMFGKIASHAQQLVCSIQTLDVGSSRVRVTFFFRLSIFNSIKLSSTGKSKILPVNGWPGTSPRWPCWSLRRCAIPQFCLPLFNSSSGWSGRRTWSCGWNQPCWTTKRYCRTTGSSRSRTRSSHSSEFNWLFYKINSLISRSSFPGTARTISRIALTLSCAWAGTARSCTPRYSSRSPCRRSWHSIWARSASSRRSSSTTSRNRSPTYSRAMSHWRCAVVCVAWSAGRTWRGILHLRIHLHPWRRRLRWCPRAKWSLISPYLQMQLPPPRRRQMEVSTTSRWTFWCWTRWWSTGARRRTWAISICTWMANTSHPCKAMDLLCPHQRAALRMLLQLVHQWSIPRCLRSWWLPFVRTR